MAMSEATRSAWVSPMPIRMPVVKGMPSLPASAMVLSRRAGTLSGARSWAAPGRPSRSETLSSMIPMLTLTSRRAARSRSDMRPGLACGRSPVSSTTRSLTARR